MSLSYSRAARSNHQRSGDGEGDDVSLDSEADGLLNGNMPSTVRIETYIPPKKRTLLFDIGVLFLVLILFLVVLGVVWSYVVIPRYYNISPNHAESHDADSMHQSGWINSYSDIVICDMYLSISWGSVLTEAHRFGVHTQVSPARVGSVIVWSCYVSQQGSESVMRLIDVNGDGAQDAVFGVAQPSDLAKHIGQPQHCRQYRKGCNGLVTAVDGKTGKHIWNISTYNEIFELNCGNIDINEDGNMDCVGAGRKGSFVAFSLQDGALLWDPQTEKESYIDYAWNIYNPIVVTDTNGDNVPEVFLPHGGDPEFPPENMTRNPGRLLMMDGSTGHLLGDYIEMPDGLETYNSPVLHADKQGEKYMLIGTGGETVAGSLFLINIAHLIKQAVFIPSEAGKLKYDKTYKGLKELKNGFYTIFKAKKKGVMVPVVLADINHDGCHDIVVSSFDGFLAAYDGDRFTEIWKFESEIAESYTTPGIGYFNDDSYLDFMVHWNIGTWPDYNKSMIAVHSGKDGKPIWTFNTTRFSMTSDLVINTGQKHRDIFVFRVQGRHGTPLDTGIGVVHGIDPQRDLTRNKSGSTKDLTELDTKGSGLHCDLKDYDILASEVFIVDWQTRDNPRRVFRRDMDKFYYNPTIEEWKHKIHKRSTNWNKIFHSDDKKPQVTNRCVVMEQSSRTTGAIGDANGDGKLDLVLTFNAQGMINNVDGGYLSEKSKLDLTMIEIEKNFWSYPILKTNHDLESSRHEGEGGLDWKPISKQLWTGYMGSDSLSKYHH